MTGRGGVSAETSAVYEPMTGRGGVSAGTSAVSEPLTGRGSVSAGTSAVSEPMTGRGSVSAETSMLAKGTGPSPSLDPARPSRVNVSEHDDDDGAGDASDTRGASEARDAATTAEASATTIDIVINGVSRTVPAGLTLTGLIDHLGLTGKRVAVERNRVIAPRATHATTLVSAGDRLELVTFVGGG
jgi:sulfur carrier protein